MIVEYWCNTAKKLWHRWIEANKPDRHLVRLAERFGYGGDVQEMCRRISVVTGDRIGVVDVVLWRAMNLGVAGIAVATFLTFYFSLVEADRVLLRLTANSMLRVW